MNQANMLRETFRREGHWHGGEAAAGPAWYVRLMLGVAAWLAACLLLPGFVFIFDESMLEGAAGVGIAALACFAGCVLTRQKGVFLSQFGSAGVLASLAIAGFLAQDAPGGLWVVALLAAAAYAGSADYVNRVLCGLVLAGVLILELAPGQGMPWNGGPGTVAGTMLAWAGAIFWRSEAVLRPQAAVWLEPAAWSCTVAASIAVWFFDGAAAGMVPTGPAPLAGMRVSAGIACAVLPLACWGAVAFTRQARHRALPRPRARVLVGVLLFSLVPVFVTAPGIALGLAWLILGMAHSRPILLAAGMAALLTYLARHYYLLHLSLLAKAGWLAVAGVLVLLAAFVLARIRWEGER